MKSTIQQKSCKALVTMQTRNIFWTTKVFTVSKKSHEKLVNSFTRINSLHVSSSFSIYYFCYCCSCKFTNFLNMFSGTTIREWDLQKYQFMVFLISMYDTPEYRFLWPLFFHMRTGFSDFVFTWKNIKLLIAMTNFTFLYHLLLLKYVCGTFSSSLI